MAKKYGDQLHAEGSLTVAATPAAQTVTLGWSPRYVKAYNLTQQKIAEHFDGMTDAHYVYTAGSTGIVTNVTSNGITLSATGFTLGTGIQTAEADVVYYIALR